tara:strand:+ start:588 stop:818 length:231 start_codon:yes stop_codon:yes gene_type:complete
MRYEQFLGGDSRKSMDKEKNKGVSKRLKYCKTCNLVWEIDYTLGHPVMYYEDFPTIGLERLECEKCNVTDNQHDNQ